MVRRTRGTKDVAGQRFSPHFSLVEAILDFFDDIQQFRALFNLGCDLLQKGDELEFFGSDILFSIFLRGLSFMSRAVQILRVSMTASAGAIETE